jgi:PPOX class probable F420-dependent enzyme
VNRRKQIELDPQERSAYLREQLTMILVSNGRDGYPHAIAMWFVLDDDGCIYMTTFGKSQKAVNLRRDPRVTLLVESGVEYHLLKGVMIRGTAEVIDDPERAVKVLAKIHAKHFGTLTPEVEQVLRGQAAKRAVLKITPERVASWDHQKLGGLY